METTTEARVVLVATGSPDEARDVATALVGERVAACVQEVPVTSTYRWEGVVQRDAEVLLLVKTTAGRLAEVERVVRAHHSYDVPEILALDVTAGHGPYLAWLVEQVRPGASEQG